MVLGREALGIEVARGADRLQDGEVVLAADRDRGVDEIAQLEQELLGLLRGRLLDAGDRGRLVPVSYPSKSA
ncbi:hypothetical protein SANTM175S_07600 [Streptomyces antimycoticus]